MAGLIGEEPIMGPLSGGGGKAKIVEADGNLHLSRHLGEFDFRYSTHRISDRERTDLMLKGSTGKRLTYRRTGEAAHA
jgi:hypothetical protein